MLVVKFSNVITYRARICKHLRSPGIDSEKSIPQPSSLASQYDNPIPTKFLAPIDCLKIPAQKKDEKRIGGGQRVLNDL
jgi:hypothetical protein